MNSLGKHLLLDLRDCDKKALNDLEYLREALLSAAKVAGATIVGESFHQFSPCGISGVVIIAESHLFLHTWPEYGYAAVDIFTCGDSVECETAATTIIAKLQSQNPTIIEMRRGVLLPQPGGEQG